MSKTSKGCLIGIITFILILTISIFIIVDKMNTTFQNDKSKVDIYWEKYTSLLKYRNKILMDNKNIKNLLPLIVKTEQSLNNKDLKKELLKNEYILNDSLRKYKFEDFLNNKLNSELINYNNEVKEFNYKYASFPYNYLRINNSVELYDYFEIEYGTDNNEVIEKNKKIEDWIENGGVLKD